MANEIATTRENNEFQIFDNPEFGKIRIINDGDGAVLFCGADVARALGYKVPKDAIAAHCKGAVKHRTPTNGGEQEMSFIPESDLYRLAFGSKLPTAERFTDWVTSEVLPSIRKHGAYLTPDMIEQILLTPDTIIRLATDLKQEREEKLALQAQVEADRPKVEYADQVYFSKDAVNVGEFSKMIYDKGGIEIGRNRLFEWLRTKGYLMESNVPYQSWIEAGWFQVCQTTKNNRLYPVTLITGKGQQKLFRQIQADMSPSGQALRAART